MFSAAIKASAGSAPKDPQFNYVTMLLHGDGSANGNLIQTSFISDASTNNLSVAINGDTKPNNFTPYQEGYYSNYFNGSSDYITAPSNCGALGTNDFTIEMWYRSSGNNGTYARAVSQGIVGVATTGAWGLGVYRGANEFYWSSYYSGSFNDIQTGINLNDGVWHHIAATRVGTTLKLYSDGVLRATGTLPSALNFGTTSDPLMIAYQNRDNNYVNGNISNLRILIGTALYTGATYTVPTTPLTAITNTVLLTCQSGRFIDNSTNIYTITKYGSTLVAPAQPFTLPTSVATYGSGYFDGTGDYLKASTGYLTGVGTGNFTVEGWWNFGDFATRTTYFQRLWSFGTGLANNVCLNIDNSGSLVFRINDSIIVSATGSLVLNTWNHVAVVRSSGVVTIYVNGVSVGSASNSANISTQATNPFYLGSESDGAGGYFYGYQTNLRVTNTAVYTSAFTPSTTPLSVISGTSLLITQYNGAGNNSGFKDSSSNNFLVTRNGNTTQGTFTPYGSNWSNYFNASASRLEVVNSNSSMIAQGTAFTLESWVYINSNTATGNNYNTSFPFLCSATSSSSTSNGRLYSFGTTTFGFWDKASSVWLTISYTAPTSQWFHFALVSTGTVFTLYVNGASVGSVTDNSTYYSDSAYNFYIASYVGNGTAGTPPVPNMYVSNFRYTKAQVYTSNFTPSTTPLTAIANTTVLTCQSNRFVDNSTNAYTINPLGTTTPSVQRFSPFIPTLPYSSSTVGGSAYFNGSTSYLNVPSNPVFGFGTGNFTVEFFIYPTATANTWSIYHGSTTNSFIINTNSSGNLVIRQYGVADLFTSASALVVNAWNHVAVSRSGTTISLWLNGSRSNGVTGTNSTNFAITSVFVGRADSAVGWVQGFMTDVRTVNGTTVYDPTQTTITVPTAPLTSTTNTSLLLSNTNAATFDNAMMNDLETIGNAQISTSVKKFGNASMYFDGSGDGLYRPSSDLFNFGSGNFTIEFWMYINSKTGYQTLVSYGYTPQATTGWLVQTGNGDGKPVFYKMTSTTSTAVATDAGTTVNTGQWYHIAIVKNGSTTTIYRDGTSVGSGTDTNTYSATANFYVGGGSNTGFDNYYFNGYIDDLRITKGVARYIANFTPPSSAFPNN